MRRRLFLLGDFMPRVSAAFFATGVVAVLIGMCFGMYMGSHEDFTLAPAHAHLNLVGWVTMALYGTFYALTRGTMSNTLAWIHYAVSTVGVIVMVTGLALFLSHGNDKAYTPIMVPGEIMTTLGMAIFAISVFRELLRARPSGGMAKA
jgi:cbb3-type cytochrome oxidase subunit 1